MTDHPGRILTVGPLAPALAEVMRTRFDALQLPEGAGQAEFLAEHGESVSVAFTTSFAGVGTELMAALPALRAVVSVGVGFDAIDIEQARARGIGVSNTPDVLTDCVADTAVGLLIDTLRRFSAADRFVRAGRWPAEPQFPLARKVGGSRVGILGLGRIGTAIAARLTAFGCAISYHNRRPVPGCPHPYAGSAAELAEGVDVLVVATAGGPATAKLVDRTVLEALGPDGYLINIARGGVVDEDALVDLLTSGGLAGAGLDVYADEPHVPEPLLALENVVLLPHIASATVQTRRAMGDLALRNLDQFLADGTLVTPVIT